MYMSKSAEIRAVSPKGAPPPLSPYSHAILAGGILYVSGLVSMSPDGKTAGSSVAEQTRNILEQLKSVLAGVGVDLSSVVHNVILLKSLLDYQEMNRVYGEYFSTRPPARYCIRADLVRDDFLVEISATAHVGTSA